MSCASKIFLFAGWLLFQHAHGQPNRQYDPGAPTQLVVGSNERQKIDSLIRKINFQKDDAEKVRLLNTLCNILTNISFDSVMIFATQARQIAEKINYHEGLIEAIKNKGAAYETLKSDWVSAIDHYKEAMRLAEKHELFEAIHDSYSILINSYFHLGDFPAAMEVAVKGLTSATSRKDNPRKFIYNSLIGKVYFRQQNYTESLKNFESANDIADEINDDELRGLTFNQFAEVFVAQRDSQKAFSYLERSKAIFEKLYADEEFGRRHLYPNTLYRIGFARKSFGDLKMALDYTLKALEYASRVATDKFDLANYYLQAGDIYAQLKQFDKAKPYLYRGLSIAREIRHKEDMRDAYKFLSDNYAALGMYDSAYTYLDLHKQLKDSIVNEISRYRTEEIKAIYDVQEKNKVILRQENMRNFLISAFLVLLLTMAFFYNRYRLKQKNRHQQELNLRQNELFNAVASAQDDERKRIAQDIHDSLGAVLSAAKMKLSVLKSNTLSSDNAEDDKLNDALQLIDVASSELRSIAQNIMPASLAKLGLVAALRNLVSSISSNSEVKVEFKAHEINVRFIEQAEMSIYRIILELINNSIRHSGASRIIVQLVGHPQYLNISVEDNGLGFDHKQAEVDKKGIGLANITSRVKYLNGTMDIDSEGGRGTSVIIDIPYEGIVLKYQHSGIESV